MKVPYSWLQELLPGLSAELAGRGDGGPAGEITKLVETLDGIGLSVEQVLEQPAAPSGVVVARVVRVEPVAGSEHLLRAEVTDGDKAYGVVTGAPNTKAGMLTALAKPGAVLDGGAIVAERELAGVRSEGVLASPKELGLFDYGGGLIEFAGDVRPGQPLTELWPAETVIELELTPNRADAFSIFGVARDLSAKLALPYRHPAYGLGGGDETLETGLRVELRDRACPRFTLRLIEGVTVGPSPLWLQRRLAAVGLRSRNNVVDVTNYVTLELGQPSHAYDRAALYDGAIVVRRAQGGERLTALDEEDYALAPADLLITTPNPVRGGDHTVGGVGEVPIGIAGVIGGLQSSVTGNTRAVALEVAHFDPVTVRKTAKRLGLSTEASYRFERGVDPNLPPLAAARAAGLIADLAGGRLHPGLTQVGGDIETRFVRFRPSRVMSLMAIEVPPGEQRGYLEALGCTVAPLADDLWDVTTPSWRVDLAIE
ncbi:MAG: phenylalanine--tRNA ligase subunit beta, partial [Deinococcota bacterium]|nr:phenylalanine--tRNA ligase subunit beta [Deinococcota bacterium]